MSPTNDTAIQPPGCLLDIRQSLDSNHGAMPSSEQNPDRPKKPEVTRAIDFDRKDDLSFDLSENGAASHEPSEQLSLRTLEKDRGTSLPLLGDYLIEAPIGAGGMGQVFRARHRTMDREVALKVLPRSLSNDPAAVERFYAEVRASARLMHPNIVTAFDAGCYNVLEHPVHFLVMELILGELLSTKVTGTGPLSTQDVVNILFQAASALEYAHSQGIIHRDIKPNNMMITAHGVLKILDFGLAIFREGNNPQQSATSSTIVGTVEFMAPEQINTPALVDHRCDLYSLGASIFYLLTGRPMFHGEVIQTALAQVHRKPQALYEVRSDVDIRLDSVFQSLVAKNPDDRVQSATELRDKMIRLNLVEQPALPVQRPNLSLGSLVQSSPTKFGSASTSRRTFASIGMELGMIRSRVSYVNREHKIEEISLDEESLELRNILYSEGEQIAVGRKANEQRSRKPENIFYGMQRWYGLPILERPFGGRQSPPEVLVASILRHMLVTTRHQLPDASHAVINVPACYDQMHRIATKTACSIAGIELLQLLDKPVAAALAHKEIEIRLAHGSGGDPSHRDAAIETMLVVMLAGAACEVSIVRVTGATIQLLATEGDWKRGMVRWHDRAGKKIAGEIEKRFAKSAKEDRAVASQIQRTVERAFDRLRVVDKVPFVIDLPQGRYEDALERDELQRWVEDLVQDIPEMTTKVIERCQIDPKEFTSVLCLGEVSWMGSIRRRLQAVVGTSTPLVDISTADLARGAALQAAYMMPPLEPNSPHGVNASGYELGVIVQEDGRLSPPRILIPRDHSLPVSMTKVLRFSKEGKRQPILQFVEGSRFGPSTWNKLGSIDLQTCFFGRSASDPLQLSIEVDASGLWSGSIGWPAGNQQRTISPLNEPTMDLVTMNHWRDWLESLLLVNPA
jgi:eukaryotic-like serine/threonine-protein kinase